MEIKKMQGSKNANVKKEEVNFSPMVTEIVKNEPVTVIDKKKQLEELMLKLNKLELLKKYYSKLKVKRNDLEEAYQKMEELSTKKEDHFEEGSPREFPFEIVLRGHNVNSRMEDIFTISKKETVKNFTKFLLNELGELLEGFEKDLLKESEKGNI